MKAQISRDSFDQNKNYSGVYQQQGRMLTDADWNEMVEALKHRMNRTVGAAIDSGSPREGGILLPESKPEQPKLRWGRVYVDGIYADIRGPGASQEQQDQEIPVKAFVADQQDFPGNPAIGEGSDKLAGNYLLYLDVWERLVLAIENDDLKDPALHGADTCVRTQTMAQVKLMRSKWWAPPETKGSARLEVKDPSGTKKGGSSSDRNFLLRLEVHDVVGRASEPSSVTFKWSTENGAEQHRCQRKEVPADFWDPDFVYEFFDDITEKHLGVHADPGNGWKPQRSELLTYNIKELRKRAGEGHGYVRRWDGMCSLTRDGGLWKRPEAEKMSPTAKVAVDESGAILHLDLEALDQRLSLHLTDTAGKSARFVAGDYWLVFVRGGRTTTAERLSNTPAGIDHHYLKLGRITIDQQDWKLTLTADELRCLSFPPLTRLTLDRVYYKPLNMDPPTIEGTLHKHRDELDKHRDELDYLDASMRRRRHYHGIQHVEIGQELTVNLYVETEYQQPNKFKLAVRGTRIHQLAPSTPAIVTSKDRSLALDTNGGLWAWGRKFVGLDENNEEKWANILTPERVAAERTFVAVAARGSHSLALDKAGKLWAWGVNNHGQLGTGGTDNAATPHWVESGETFTAIAAGECHSLALDTNGKLWAWGQKFVLKKKTYEEFGEEVEYWVEEWVDISKPERVAPEKAFVAVAAGGSQSLLLDANQELWAGGSHSLALDADGQLWAWGKNDHGQLGTEEAGAAANVYAFADPTPVATGVKFEAFAASDKSSLAVTADGKLWVWGQIGEWSGKVLTGNGLISRRGHNEFRKPHELNTGKIIIAAAFGVYDVEFEINKPEEVVAIIALDAAGKLWHIEVLVVSPGTTGGIVSLNILPVSHDQTFVAIAGRYRHYVALDTDGQLCAWGKNDHGQLGIGSTSELEETPEQVAIDAPFELVPIRLRLDKRDLSDVLLPILPDEFDKMALVNWCSGTGVIAEHPLMGGTGILDLSEHILPLDIGTHTLGVKVLKFVGDLQYDVFLE